jgi:hypothetical protein
VQGLNEPPTKQGRRTLLAIQWRGEPKLLAIIFVAEHYPALRDDTPRHPNGDGELAPEVCAPERRLPFHRAGSSDKSLRELLNVILNHRSLFSSEPKMRNELLSNQGRLRRTNDRFRARWLRAQATVLGAQTGHGPAVAARRAGKARAS